MMKSAGNQKLLNLIQYNSMTSFVDYTAQAVVALISTFYIMNIPIYWFFVKKIAPKTVMLNTYSYQKVG